MFIPHDLLQFLRSVKDVQKLLPRDLRDALLHRSLRLALLAKQLLATKSLRVWVQAEKDSLVAEGVLLLRERSCEGLAAYNADGKRSLTLRHSLARGAEDRLDLVGVDETGNIGVADFRCGDAERRQPILQLQ